VESRGKIYGKSGEESREPVSLEPQIVAKAGMVAILVERPPP